MIIPRIAAYALAAVLVVAAVSKLRRPEETANEFGELGLLGSRQLARLVPLIELLCATALVLAPAWGGIMSFALLAGFSAVLIGVLRSGRVVNCNCFGALGSRPVSTMTLVRNAGLLLLAGLATLF